MEQATLVTEEETPRTTTNPEPKPPRKPRTRKSKLNISDSDKETIRQLTLSQKLIEIEREIPDIKKTGKNLNQKGELQYEFVEQQTIMNAVRPLLQKYGILVIPRVLEHKLHNKTQLNNDGTTSSRGVKVVVSMEFEFINAHNSEDILTISWTAEGDDYGDKGTNKATTIAQKNMYIRLFNIADNDPDAVTPAVGAVEAPTTPAAEKKQTILLTMLKRIKVDPDEFEKKQKKTIAKMTNAEIDEAIGRIEVVIARQLAKEEAAIEPANASD